MKKILGLFLLAVMFSCEDPIVTVQEDEEIIKTDSTSKCGCDDDNVDYQKIEKL